MGFLIRIVIIGFLFLSIASYEQAKAFTSNFGLQTGTIDVNGDLRYFQTYKPFGFNRAENQVVIFAYHGGGGSMEIMSNDEIYGLQTLADQMKAIIVFPNGTSPLANGKIATWNAGKCCGLARDQRVDDVAFARKLALLIKQEFAIENPQYFSVGMSNGAMLSYRLACESSDIFQGIVAVAGSDVTRYCLPKNPVSILHIHARDDLNVLFWGGAGPEAADPSQITDFTAIPDVMNKWKTLNKCRDAWDKTREGRIFYQSVDRCQERSFVELILLPDGGHSWPGGNPPTNSSDLPSELLSANDEISNFVEKVLSRN